MLILLDRTKIFLISRNRVVYDQHRKTIQISKAGGTGSIKIFHQHETKVFTLQESSFNGMK